MLPQVEQSDVQMSALDLARLAHQKYIVKQQADDLERAIGYYIEAIRNDSAKAEPYYRLASLMYEKGQISLYGAIEQCRTAVTLEPDNINAHIYAGYFLSMSEDYKSAQKEFNIAIKTGKFNTARPRLFLSKLIKREIWLEGLTLGRLAKYFYYLLSGSALLMCDIGAIRLALETISDNVSVFSYKTLGETFEKAKMFSTAQKAYTMGVAQTEHGDVFYKKLGDLSMSRQDLLSGLECYKKVLRVTPDNREVLLKLATLIQTSFPERIDEAIDYYQKQVGNSGDDNEKSAKPVYVPAPSISDEEIRRTRRENQELRNDIQALTGNIQTMANGMSQLITELKKKQQTPQVATPPVYPTQQQVMPQTIKTPESRQIYTSPSEPVMEDDPVTYKQPEVIRRYDYTKKQDNVIQDDENIMQDDEVEENEIETKKGIFSWWPFKKKK